MATLWFGAGNNRNPLLWRRQVLYKIPNQSQPSTHGSSQQRVADAWPGMFILLDTECCKLKKRNYSVVKSKHILCSFIFLIQGHYLFPLARQMKLFQWVLTRSSSYGFLPSSRWRTPGFWATKFGVFAGSFPFTGSNLSILKVLPSSLLSRYYVVIHSTHESIKLACKHGLFYLKYCTFYHSFFKAWLWLPCLSADTLVNCTVVSEKLVKHLMSWTYSTFRVHQKRLRSCIKKEWSWNMQECLKSRLLI